VNGGAFGGSSYIYQEREQQQIYCMHWSYDNILNARAPEQHQDWRQGKSGFGSCPGDVVLLMDFECV
jgi:hypothetical protein